MSRLEGVATPTLEMPLSSKSGTWSGGTSDRNLEVLMASAEKHSSAPGRWSSLGRDARDQAWNVFRAVEVPGKHREDNGVIDRDAIRIVRESHNERRLVRHLGTAP